MTPQAHLDPTPTKSLKDAEQRTSEPSPRAGTRSPHPYAYIAASTGKLGKEKLVNHTRVAVDHSSESGTEADDESGVFFKGLPPPPERPHKGLRTNDEQDEGISPLVTPNFLHAEKRTLSADGLKKLREDKEAAANEEQIIRERYAKRKSGEIVRRAVEVGLLATVAIVVCHDAGITLLLNWWQELSSHVLVVASSYAVLLFRKRHLFRQNEVPDISVAQLSFHYPSSFDPAPLLYPIFLPLLVSISLMRWSTTLILPNCILGIASLPAQCIPFHSIGLSFSLAQWTATIAPLVASENALIEDHPAKPLALKAGLGPTLEPEYLVALYPLHIALTETIQSLTTSSLDPAEVQLLSTALLNLYLFSTSPQMKILKSLLWIGAVFLFIFCRHVLIWELTLARIPSWRFRNPRRVYARPSLQKSAKRSWFSQARRYLTRQGPDSSDSDSPTKNTRLTRRFHGGGNLVVDTSQSFPAQAIESSPPSAIEPLTKWQSTDANGFSPDQSLHQRRHTLGDLEHKPVSMRPAKRTTTGGRPKRSFTPNSRSFFSLTATEALLKRWLYASYVYVMILLIVMGPIRTYVGKEALYGREPLGWALGYLFGNVPAFRLWVVKNNLENWIRLPTRISSPSQQRVGLIEELRQQELGEANTRLLLFGCWIALLMVGIGMVSRLSTVVEVDTRRKVFHGLIVAMVLPTVPIDPCFIALALSLVLAVFLLLDSLRACQVPPIASPLTHFLAPYVDGRDHRGPVIVSPMFLLIGCAIPLWLSLAGLQRTGDEPWTGWEATSRDVSMVSGVICVGMGDAAASLIGRRYGRHKWYWGGGKSIEGSFAFAFAVSIGLVAAKAWLRVGGWLISQEASISLARITLAASGASVAEAVLTGANDNVVVPLILWLLVRGLQI